MNRVLWAFTALLMFSIWSMGQADKKAEKKTGDKSVSSAPKAGGAEEALMDLERKWAAADLKNDSATIEDILADSWSAINTEGKLMTRAAVLEETKKHKLTRSELSEMKVRMLNPDTAIVTGVWTGAGIDGKGQKFDRSERWTDVFTKQGSTWRCVASQSTTIQK